MNNSRESESQVNSGWECIDPVVGNCLWELEVEDTTEKRACQLHAHLQLCDACRLDQAMSGRLEAGLQAGELVLPSKISEHWWQRSAVQASVGSALVAACLALLIILPPAPSGDFVHLRAAVESPHFLRPVEGEVVMPTSTVMSWEPVAGASSYQVTLTDVDGGFHWVGSTRNTELELPDLVQGRQTLRAVLTTVPADLVMPGRISVSFSTGSGMQMAQDRLMKAPVWLTLLGIGGLFLMSLSLFSRRRQ